MWPSAQLLACLLVLLAPRSMTWMMALSTKHKLIDGYRMQYLASWRVRENGFFHMKMMSFVKRKWKWRHVVQKLLLWKTRPCTWPGLTPMPANARGEIFESHRLWKRLFKRLWNMTGWPGDTKLELQFSLRYLELITQSVDTRVDGMWWYI